jgi:glycerol kinase
MSKAKVVAAIDQGTTSSRFILFDESGSLLASKQAALEQIYLQAGYA